MRGKGKKIKGGKNPERRNAITASNKTRDQTGSIRGKKKKRGIIVPKYKVLRFILPVNPKENV